MNEKLLKIINHYGVMPQLKYFQSEVFELNEAIAMFAKSLWEEGFLNVSVKYDKETGEIFRELSINANKKIYN